MSRKVASPGRAVSSCSDCLLNLLRAGIEARLSGAPAEVSDLTAVYMLRCLGMDPAEVSRVRAIVARGDPQSRTLRVTWMRVAAVAPILIHITIEALRT